MENFSLLPISHPSFYLHPLSKLDLTNLYAYFLAATYTNAPVFITLSIAGIKTKAACMSRRILDCLLSSTFSDTCNKMNSTLTKYSGFYNCSK